MNDTLQRRYDREDDRARRVRATNRSNRRARRLDPHAPTTRWQ